MSDDRVLENFVDASGRLLAIPVQRKKRMAVLRWLVEDFQPGRLYPETEVNRLLGRRHADFWALRRYLVDEELMQRRHGVYWRTGSVPNVGFDPPRRSKADEPLADPALRRPAERRWVRKCAPR